MKLLTSQKNTLYNIIEECGLSPSQFEFSTINSNNYAGQKATKLKYKDSDYFFLFETGFNLDSEHFAVYCPGNEVHTEKAYPASWEYQLDHFRTWLKYLSREINSPNKWERLYEEIESISIRFDNDRDKFSAHEYQDLTKRIELLKQGISSIGLLSEQVTVINDKLDHLTDLAKEMNKFDWKSLFIGTILSIIIQLSITPDDAKSLWTLIKQVFNNYLLS